MILQGYSGLEAYFIKGCKKMEDVEDDNMAIYPEKIQTPEDTTIELLKIAVTYPKFSDLVIDVIGYITKEPDDIIALLKNNYKKISSAMFQLIYNKLPIERQEEVNKYKMLNKHKGVI